MSRALIDKITLLEQLAAHPGYQVFLDMLAEDLAIYRLELETLDPLKQPGKIYEAQGAIVKLKQILPDEFGDCYVASAIKQLREDLKDEAERLAPIGMLHG